MLEDVLRRAGLGDLAVGHEQHTVAHLAGEAHLVRDDDHRHALVRQLLHNVEHFADHLGVERARRLVKEHDLRVHGERTHDGDALLLPAGERGRIAVAAVGQTDAGKELVRLRIRLRLRHELRLHGRERDVAAHGHVREQVEVLEHHAHLAAHGVDIHLRVGDLRTGKGNGAGRWLLEQVQAAQERRLTGAGGADDDHVFTGADMLGNVIEHEVVAERFGQVFNVDHFDAASFQAHRAAWKTA